MKTETKTAHTPGPWGTNGRQLPCGCKSDELQTIYCGLHTAAPELLEACKLALPELQNKASRYHPALVAIKKAIAKMEGKK